MNKRSFHKEVGFTLIELISVIVILGVLAVGVSSFLKFGTQIYTEATARDKIISSARFSIERLNREIRNALPNTLKVSGKCLQFTPIIASTIYIDLPVLPEVSSSTLEVIPFNDDEFDQVIVNKNIKAIVYPLEIDDLLDTSNKNYTLLNLDKSVEPWVVSFGSAIHFDSDSPSQRIYFINDNRGDDINYCLIGTDLMRNGVLMAENIKNNVPFQVTPASLRRNGLVRIDLLFDKNSEQVRFINEVQVLNVP
jgi:MSHA biogenesis protein MshO